MSCPTIIGKTTMLFNRDELREVYINSADIKWIPYIDKLNALAENPHTAYISVKLGEKVGERIA